MTFYLKKDRIVQHFYFFYDSVIISEGNYTFVHLHINSSLGNPS